MIEPNDPAVAQHSSGLKKPIKARRSKPVATVTLTPAIAPWVSEDVRKRSLVLLDFAADCPSSGLRVTLDAIFRAIPVRLSLASGRADYYIATTGGRIRVDLRKGSLLEYTEAIEIRSSYRNTVKSTQIAAIKVSPSLGSGEASAPTARLAAGITLESGQERIHECRFDGLERTLQPTREGDQSLEWKFHSTRSEKAVSDFVAGNLILYFVSAWAAKTIVGTVEFVPENVTCFDNQRRRLSDLKSAAMYLYLFLKRYRVDNVDGTRIHFKAKR
jgi:hypothetical protein